MLARLDGGEVRGLVPVGGRTDAGKELVDDVCI